jgi:hypothetical protein
MLMIYAYIDGKDASNAWSPEDVLSGGIGTVGEAK